MSDIKIYNEDCLEHIKTIDDKSIDLIVTDPPYDLHVGIEGGSCASHMGRNDRFKNENVAGIKDFGSGYDIKTFGKEFVRIMKDINIYLWCNKLQIPDYFNYYVNELGCKFDILCWHKCLSPDTLLLTKNYNNKIKLLTLSDINKRKEKLYVHNGITFIPITNIVKVQHDIWYEIQLANGNNIKCSGDHKFYVNGIEILAKDLKEKQILDHRIIKYDFKEDKSGITDDIAWFCGYYLANGSYAFKNTGNRIDIALNKKKEWILKRIIKLVSLYPGYYDLDDNTEGYGITIRIYSAILKNFVQQFICGDDAYSKHFSDEVYNSSERIMKNILQGYLDGDGCYDVNIDRYRLNFTGKNSALANDLIAICNILHYNIHLRKSTAKLNNKIFPSYTGQIKFTNVVSNKGVNPYTIKKIIVHNNLKNFYDISVDVEDHKFILFDGTETHNCNAMPTYNNKYLTDTEYCLYFRNGSGQLKPTSYEDAKTFWIEPINQTDKRKYKHPTIKPLNMIEKLVNNSSKEGDVVFDPFLGSGTTAVACKKLNRNFIGTEINEEFYKIALNRIKEIEEEKHLTEFFV